MRDVSDRKRTERELQSVMDSLDDIVYRTNRNGEFIFVSESISKFLGYKAEEILGRKLSDFYITPAGQDDLMTRLQADGNSVRGIENVLRHRDGREILVSTNAHFFYGPAGELMGMEGISRDVTERRHKERKILASERKLKRILETANEGFWLIGANYVGMEVNRAMEQIVGLPAEEILGRPFTDFLDAENEKKWRAKIALRVEERNRSYEISLKRADGSSVPCLFNATTLYDDDDRLVGSFALVSDISEIKQAHENLRIAKEVAELANQAKSEFLSSMSHELRTPLNSVIGFAQMMEFSPNEPLTELQQKCVSHILGGGNHLLALINDVLDLAKIEAGRIEMSIENVSLEHIVDDCLSLLQPLADKRDIEIVNNCDSQSDMMVKADYTRLKQSLINLGSNGIKYNVEGGALTIGSEVIGEGTIRISITDTGPGIPLERQGELFQAFNRLDAEGSNVEGTGIGLVLTKSVVEEMDGEIGFASKPGKGSTFWVDLPHWSEEPQMQETHERRKAGLVSSSVKGSILYVEDNRANIDLMQMIVDQLPGLELVTATSGEEGLELVKNMIRT